MNFSRYILDINVTSRRVSLTPVVLSFLLAMYLYISIFGFDDTLISSNYIVSLISQPFKIYIVL